MSVERAVAQLLLLSFIDGKKVLEELCVGRFSLATGISHLRQFLYEFADTLADLERAAFFESWTGQLPARPLHLVIRIAYGHLSLLKAGHLNIASFKVIPMGAFGTNNKKKPYISNETEIKRNRFIK